jgi:hypothetical protein
MIAAAGPVVAGTLLVVAVASLELFGWTPFSMSPVNIAEAAAAGNAAETLRLLEQGADPARVEAVRPEIVSSEITRLNALEAAIWSRQVELVTLLDRRGAIAASARHDLACLASDLGADDIVEYFGEETSSSCQAGAARERVVRRSAGAAGE